MKAPNAMPIVLLALLSLTTSLAAQQQQQNAEPPRTVTLPRYMTDISQPIPDELKLPDAPKTSREVSCFGAFTERSKMVDVVRECGVPDDHQGSGIYIFIYKMSDGSVVAVGTPDLKRLFYIDHLTNQGASHLLRASDPSRKH